MAINWLFDINPHPRCRDGRLKGSHHSFVAVLLLKDEEDKGGNQGVDGNGSHSFGKGIGFGRPLN